jgi:hypothetical protein
MTALLDKGSSGDDDFAGLLARLDEAMGVSNGLVSCLTIGMGGPVNPWDLRAGEPGVAL